MNRDALSWSEVAEEDSKLTVDGIELCLVMILEVILVAKFWIKFVSI